MDLQKFTLNYTMLVSISPIKKTSLMQVKQTYMTGALFPLSGWSIIYTLDIY